MNNHKTAITILNQADTLKAKVFIKNDVLNEPDFRIEQHQLQTMYHQVLVLDLEYALDKKIEQELWNVGFKHYITILQEIIKDKKNPRRSEAQALLTSCLQSASGFYLSLLQELYSKFEIPGPFKRKNAVYGQAYPNINSENVKLPRTSSCIYICQYCLVHLGDIARYMNKRREAESFYKQAIKASPTSGHPYNQLALLEATQGDKLSTVFHYVRGIAVKNPFPATATNLSNTFNSLIDKEEHITEVQTKMSVNDFIRLFLKVHGLLYTITNLQQADLCVKSINATLTPLVATQSFTADKLIKMTVINLYAYHHTVGDVNQNELTLEELRAKELILDLISGSLSAFLLPVYTLKNDLSLLDYYALPAIKLIICWINKDASILSENVFANKLQIWPSFCKLLNTLETFSADVEHANYKTIALNEDRELQGFLPLKETFKELDFNAEAPDESIQKYERARRLIIFGLWLTDIDLNQTRLIMRKEDVSDGKIVFEPGCFQPDPTDKLLEEMKSIELTDKSKKLKGPERRNGILKPQGSLEKAREEREFVLNANTEQNNMNNFNSNDLSKLKRVKQNVALQSIFKKMEENKQVKFSNETTDKTIKNKNIIKPMNQSHLPNTPTFMPNPSQVPNVRNNIQDLLTFEMAPMSKVNIDQSLNSNPFVNADNNQNQQNTSKIGHQQQQQWFSNISNVNQLSNNVPENHKNFNQFPMNFNKTVLPPDRPTNVWSKEERPQVPTWWPNTMQQNMVPPRNYGQNFMPNSQNFIQQQYDTYNFAFPHTNNSVPHSPTSSINIDMFKQNMQQHQGDVNNPSWSSNTKNMMGNDNVIGFNMNNMTVRQAMLNETRRMQNTTPTRVMNNDSNNVNPQNSPSIPGYSLFNPSSWTPNLPGQICGRFNTDNTPGVQQSLFSNNGSQSLKQLLEQQNQLSKDDT